MRGILSIIFLAFLFLISSVLGSTSASLKNIKGDSTSVAVNEKAELYCGLASPPNGEGGTTEGTGGTGEEPIPTPTPTPKPNHLKS